MIQTLSQRINAIAHLHGTFTLRSGEVSDTYFDKYRFEAEPSQAAKLCARSCRLFLNPFSARMPPIEFHA